MGQSFRGLEATIEGGGEHKWDLENKDSEHKEDSKEAFQDDYTKNQTKQKNFSQSKKSNFFTLENQYMELPNRKGFSI